MTSSRRLASREPERALRLAREVERLADALEAAPDENARISCIAQPDGGGYHLFELVESGRVAACIRFDPPIAR